MRTHPLLSLSAAGLLALGVGACADDEPAGADMTETEMDDSEAMTETEMDDEMTEMEDSGDMEEDMEETEG